MSNIAPVMTQVDNRSDWDKAMDGPLPVAPAPAPIKRVAEAKPAPAANKTPGEGQSYTLMESML